MSKYIAILFIALFSIGACSKEKPVEEPKPDIPIDIDKPGNKINKPVQLWIDAHANFSRFATKPSITSYLEKIKETGFNEIYVDVKPGIGYALYNSDILPKLTQWGNETVERDWDYLGYMIEEAERLEISVYASISTLGFGYTKAQQGFVYDDKAWDGKTQMEMPDCSNPDNLVDVRDQPDVDSAMLNPCLPEVQSLVISVVAEIITKYPKLKGICLDYCRWYGSNYGLEDVTLTAFESYSGQKVTSRNDIITATGGGGPLYNQWIEFRSMTVTNLITSIRSKVKSINPQMELHLWASADWGSRYGVGQNWASKNYVPSGWVYTGTYSKTGFADQLDVFSLGAYAEAVWKTEAPGSVWSVENFVTTYSNYTKGECKVIGCIATYSYGGKATATSDAVYLCLKNTDGVAVFELSHIINNNQWAAIKDGIERVMK
jgi:hypothetical protein